MTFSKKFPLQGWAKVQPGAPQNLGAIDDWGLVGGNTYRIIDIDIEKSLVYLYTYNDLGKNLWFYSEFLIPTSEPIEEYTNRMIEENNRIEAFQKALRDKMMKEVFSSK